MFKLGIVAGSVSAGSTSTFGPVAPPPRVVLAFNNTFATLEIGAGSTVARGTQDILMSSVLNKSTLWDGSAFYAFGTVFTGTGYRILRSTDGITWTSVKHATTDGFNTFRIVSNSNGRLLAFMSNSSVGATYVMVSNDNGLTWSNPSFLTTAGKLYGVILNEANSSFLLQVDTGFPNFSVQEFDYDTLTPATPFLYNFNYTIATGVYRPVQQDYLFVGADATDILNPHTYTFPTTGNPNPPTLLSSTPYSFKVLGSPFGSDYGIDTLIAGNYRTLYHSGDLNTFTAFTNNVTSFNITSSQNEYRNPSKRGNTIIAPTTSQNIAVNSTIEVSWNNGTSWQVVSYPYPSNGAEKVAAFITTIF